MRGGRPSEINFSIFRELIQIFLQLFYFFALLLDFFLVDRPSLFLALDTIFQLAEFQLLALSGRAFEQHSVISGDEVQVDTLQRPVEVDLLGYGGGKR